MVDLIELRLLEFHVVHHCNLTCVGCSHFAPTAPKWLSTPSELENDVRLAATRLAPDYVHVLGGEPLLHPNLDRLLSIVRRGFPLPVVKLVTNGVLLPRARPELFAALVENDISLSVSIYPGVRCQREQIIETCESYGIRYEFWQQNTFLDFIDPDGRNDPVKSREKCPMDNACNVRNGRLYPCPVTAWADFGFLPWQEENGVHLSEPVNVIRSVLDRTRITSCCRFCRAAPERVPHTLGRRQRRVRDVK